MSVQPRHYLVEISNGVAGCRCGWSYRVPILTPRSKIDDILLDEYSKHRKAMRRNSGSVAVRLTAIGSVMALAVAMSYALAVWSARLASDIAETSLALADRAHQAATSQCSPIYMVVAPEWGCSARIGWPPVSCAPKVLIYRSADLGRVLGRVNAMGQRSGLAVYRETGDREAAIKIEWEAKTK